MYKYIIIKLINAIYIIYIRIMIYIHIYIQIRILILNMMIKPNYCIINYLLYLILSFLKTYGIAEFRIMEENSSSCTQ